MDIQKDTSNPLMLVRAVQKDDRHLEMVELSAGQSDRVSSKAASITSAP
ncbi:MAG: hypothetical protein PHE26_01005 [Syntrophomonadaceae bacterium]|nr:hypothetical protein [Syntrophomonadaceae bacterium]